MDDEEYEGEEVQGNVDGPEDLTGSSLKDLDPVVAFIKRQFSNAEDAKRADETRALDAYRNYRGRYADSVKFTATEKSRVFVKVTKTKVQAAYGQICEVLFGGGKFPLSIDQTKLPEGVVDTVHFDPAAPPQKPDPAPYGTRDDEGLAPGSTHYNLKKLPKKLEPIADKLQAGPGVTPTAVTFSPAHIAAKKMEKKIHDQLEEAEASKQLRSFAFEMSLFGTGIIKGPLAFDKEYPNWDENGEYRPITKSVPVTTHVSFWDFYPDPEAKNMSECEFVVERHKLSETNLQELARNKSFDKNAIKEVISIGPNYERKYWESMMEESNNSASNSRYEVLEYWGTMSRELALDYGIKIPVKLKKEDYLNVNVWICGDTVIRLTLNPFKPSYLPYHAAPYEMNPYSFFGIGVAENMEDTQTLMNGFMRMAVDNAALSGNLVFEVDETNLSPDQDLEVYAGKVFRRQGGAPGQAIFGHKFPNVSQENMMMFDKARVLADESTGLPSYSYGQTGIQGVGRTASGISMLMNAAAGSIRTVVKNIDDYLITPLGKGFFAFNMQFDHDPEIKGDLAINARGTESLMAKEVKSQRLMQFLQVVSNPMLAPFAKLDVIVREIAVALDLDPEKVANSLPDAAIQAELLKQFGPPQGPEGQSGPPPPGANPMDTSGSGGGTIGTGSVPGPNEPGFSANTG